MKWKCWRKCQRKYLTECFFVCAVTSTRRRSRSSAEIAAKDSASRALWPSTGSFTWRNRRTSVRSVRAASTSAPTSRLTCWRTPTSNRTSVRRVERSSGGIVTWGAMLWRTPSVTSELRAKATKLRSIRPFWAQCPNIPHHPTCLIRATWTMDLPVLPKRKRLVRADQKARASTTTWTRRKIRKILAIRSFPSLPHRCPLHPQQLYSDRRKQPLPQQQRQQPRHVTPSKRRPSSSVRRSKSNRPLLIGHPIRRVRPDSA